MTNAETSAATPARESALIHTRAVFASLLRHAVLMGACLLMLYPLLWMVASAFKPEEIIFTDLSIIPPSLDFKNFREGWTALQVSFTTFYWNSLVIAVLVVVGNVLSCSLAAYAFARLDFAFRKIWFGLMLGTLMLPFQATMIPQYTIFYKLNWINTFLPLVVPQLLACDAFFIFLMVQFIRGIPRELDEAAAIDGAGHARVFFSVILPLLRPALLTTGVLTFIWTFNDFLRQLVYLSDKSRYTVPLGLNSFIDRASGSSYGGMLAMSVVTLVPTVAVFLICQKRLVDGVANSGIKG